MRAAALLLALSAPAAAQDFAPIHEVLSHPRCVNCHVGADGIPLQGGDDGPAVPHAQNVHAGESRMGLETVPCATCHRAENGVLPGSAPGVEGWALAPVEMRWVARSAGEICEQLKDPARNGGKTLEEVARHMGHDPLVVWGWAPGPGREPPPGTPARAEADVLAWAAAGAPCP